MNEPTLDLIPAEPTVVEFLIVADHAEVVNGKVYLMGGGWDQFNPSEYPAVMKLGIAAGVRIPYLEANINHHLSLVLRTGDGKDLFRVEADMETGRPPGSRGDAALVPLAINTDVPLEAPTLLELVADVDGRSTRRVAIRATGPRQGSPRGPGSGR